MVCLLYTSETQEDEYISISKIEYDIKEEIGTYPVTFATSNGTSVSIDVFVVQQQYVENPKANEAIAAFNFFKTVDEIKESAALDTDLKTWANAQGWKLSNEDESVDISVDCLLYTSLASAQLETAVGLGEGAAQLAAGQTALAVQEAQMEAASKEAGASLDTDSILSAATIEAMLGAQNFRMPAGYVNEEGIDYLVRIGDKFESVDEMKNLILLDMEGIDPIKLSDVADVEVVNNADETYAKINGKPGVMLSIQKQTGYSTGDVSHRVQDKLEELNKEYKDLKVVNLMDQGMYIDTVSYTHLDVYKRQEGSKKAA